TVQTWLLSGFKEDDISKLCRDLMSILEDWPRPLDLQPSPARRKKNQRSPVQLVKKRIADELTLRAVLSRIERLLVELRYQLLSVEEHVEGTGGLCDALDAYMPWAPSPLGP